MKVLLVAATEFEAPMNLQTKNGDLDILISGPGILNTVYTMMVQMKVKKYDFAIQAGICGAFHKNLSLGETVEVVSEEIADLGAEDDTSFQTVFEMGLMDKNMIPYQNGKILFPENTLDSLRHLKKVHGITVNKVHGNEESIAKAIEKFQPEVESMEGAAFAYVCKMQNIPAVQVRAISNYVEKRNKANWKIELAVSNLHKVLVTLIHELQA
ncbi:MAG: futalosine hydrolase [Chitinophagales bacterium]